MSEASLNDAFVGLLMQLQYTAWIQLGKVAHPGTGKDIRGNDAPQLNVAEVCRALGVTLAHNVQTKAEADSVIAEALAAGATLLKPAADTFWGGYSGYFADPDGHPWEVAWNPYLPME